MRILLKCSLMFIHLKSHRLRSFCLFQILMKYLTETKQTNFILSFTLRNYFGSLKKPFILLLLISLCMEIFKFKRIQIRKCI